jgi:hypothetical protein
MAFTIGEGAPPPRRAVRPKGSGPWGAAKAAAENLEVGQNIRLEGIKRGSALSMAGALKSHGKFVARTGPDGVVTIYRVA